MRTRLFLSAALALTLLCALASASSPLPGSRLAHEAAAATDPAGNKLSMKDGAGTTRYGYNAADRPAIACVRPPSG